MFVPAQPAWAILVSTSTFLCNNFNNHFYTVYKDGNAWEGFIYNFPIIHGSGKLVFELKFKQKGQWPVLN